MITEIEELRKDIRETLKWELENHVGEKLNEWEKKLTDWIYKYEDDGK